MRQLILLLPKIRFTFLQREKKFAIKEATVVWYKGEILTKNRFKVEENIEINNSGYFTAELSIPGGLEEGEYGVAIFNGNNDIIEQKIEFKVKN